MGLFYLVHSLDVAIRKPHCHERNRGVGRKSAPAELLVGGSESVTVTSSSLNAAVVVMLRAFNLPFKKRSSIASSTSPLFSAKACFAWPAEYPIDTIKAIFGSIIVVLLLVLCDDFFCVRVVRILFAQSVFGKIRRYTCSWLACSWRRRHRASEGWLQTRTGTYGGPRDRLLLYRNVVSYLLLNTVCKYSMYLASQEKKPKSLGLH